MNKEHLILPGNIGPAKAAVDELENMLRKPKSALEHPAVAEAERILRIRRFTPEEKELLTNNHYAIYCLTGLSIGQMQDMGLGISNASEIPNLKQQLSIMSEVAINLKRPYLRSSKNKPYEEQVKDVEKFSGSVEKQMPGAKVILGTAADYINLSLAHFKTKRNNLFTHKFHGNPYIRTVTIIDNHFVETIVNARKKGELYVVKYDIGMVAPDIVVAPLIVPR